MLQQLVFQRIERNLIPLRQDHYRIFDLSLLYEFLFYGIRIGHYYHPAFRCVSVPIFDNSPDCRGTLDIVGRLPRTLFQFRTGHRQQINGLRFSYIVYVRSKIFGALTVRHQHHVHFPVYNRISHKTF